jgi:hypothetical protein
VPRNGGAPIRLPSYDLHMQRGILLQLRKIVQRMPWILQSDGIEGKKYVQGQCEVGDGFTFQL